MQPNHQIFQGIAKEELEELLNAIGYESIVYPKNAVLLQQGDENVYISLLEAGDAHAVRYTTEGREVDFAFVHAGDLFGDALSLSKGEKSPVRVIADKQCRVLRFRYAALTECELPCAGLVLQNLAKLLAEKYFCLQRRVQYLTCQSLREKILSYLTDCSRRAQRNVFYIPFDRNALASYLCCDRSALSRELASMQKDGILRYHKNQFTLLSEK